MKRKYIWKHGGTYVVQSCAQMKEKPVTVF